jgi:hypothetical protein
VEQGRERGGSLGLIELIDERGPELYADFRRYYQLDLCDLARGQLSPKLALALIRHLPLDSAYVTALRGGPAYAGWDRHAYLVADLYDAINGLAYLYQTAHSDPKKPKAKPLPLYPRPGVEAKTPADRPTDPLRARLRGDAPVPPLGPGSRIPPPSRP